MHIRQIIAHLFCFYTMRQTKIIYRVSTTLALLVAWLPAITYFTDPNAAQVFQQLGFPDYFRVELAVLKLLGLLAIVLPGIPRDLKVMAYAGYFIIIISAAIANYSTTGSIGNGLMPLGIGLLFLVSYIYFRKLENSPVVKKTRKVA